MRRISRGNNKSRSSTRGKVNQTHRAITRLNDNIPYQSSCPFDPPSLRLGYSISKYVPLVLSIGQENFDYGSPVSVPHLRTTYTTSSSEVVFKISRYDVMLLIMHQLFGTHLSIDILIFVHASLKKIRFWGPSSTDNSATVSLTLYDILEKSEDRLDTHAAPVFTDSGTPTRRPRISVSMPSPQWFLYDEDSAKRDILVAAKIEQGGLRLNDHVGVMHLLISLSLGTTL